MKIFALLATLALAHATSLLVAPTQCGSNLKETGDCVVDLVKSHFEDFPHKDDIQEQIKDCFEKSGCTIPEQSSEELEVENSFWVQTLLERVGKKLKKLNVPGSESLDFKEMRDGFFKCGLKIAQKMKTDTESCMQKKDRLNDFALPDFFLEKHENFDHKTKAVMQALIEFFGMGERTGPQIAFSTDVSGLLDTVVDVCPTDQNKAEMQTCIQDVLTAHKPNDINCTEFETCKEKLGDDCQDIRSDLIEGLCDCSNEFIDTKFDSLYDDLKTCLETELEIKEIVPEGIPEKLAKKFAQITSKKVLNSFCNKTMEVGPIDMCQEGQGVMSFHDSVIIE